MEPVFSVPMAHSEPESLLERAFADSVGQVEDHDPITVRLLDAAYEQFCRMGIRRSTMEDVGALAGVSRITVYRRFATKDALVESVVRREFRRYFDRFLIDIEQAETVSERVVYGFASSLRTIREHPLIGVLLDDEPDAMAPSMVSDGGRTLATVRTFVAGQLRLEQQAGHIAPDVEVERVAELMVRVSASFLVIPSRLVDLDDDAELRAIAEQFLVPMLSPPGRDRPTP